MVTHREVWMSNEANSNARSTRSSDHLERVVRIPRVVLGCAIEGDSETLTATALATLNPQTEGQREARRMRERQNTKVE